MTLDAHSYGECPQCNRKVLFFDGKGGQFMSDEKPIHPDTLITLICPLHGKFEVPAGEMHRAMAEAK